MIGSFDVDLVARVLPGLRQPRAGHAAHRQPARRQRPPPVRNRVQGIRPRAAHGRRTRPARRRHHPVDQRQPVSPATEVVIVNMNKIVVVDYGMGNLRSVAQALRAVAPEADVLHFRRSRGHRRRRPHRAAGPGRDARLHAQPARVRRWRKRCCAPSKTKPADGRLRRRADAVRLRARKAIRPAWACCRARWCASSSTAGCRTTARASRCRRWAGTACARRAAHPLWEGVADDSYFYFVHSYYAAPGDATHVHRR